jgi:hypothetical protein
MSPTPAGRPQPGRRPAGKTKSSRRREEPMRQAVYDVLAPLRAKAQDALNRTPKATCPSCVAACGPSNPSVPPSGTPAPAEGVPVSR